MTAKQRIKILRLADKLQKNKSFAEKIGVSVEIKHTKKENSK